MQGMQGMQGDAVGMQGDAEGCSAQCAHCTVGSPCVRNALYTLQGGNGIPMYFDRVQGIKCQNPVYATGGKLRENHKSRV